MSDVQEIIRSANQEGLGRSFAQTFLFLWGYGRNKIHKSQDELAADSGILHRTLRSHLYELKKAGWIKYYQPTSSEKGEITLTRFTHTNDGSTD